MAGSSDGGRSWVVRREDGSEHLASGYADALLGLVRAGRGLERGLDADLRAAHGLSLHGFEVLLFLAVFSDDGGLRMSELADRAPLSQSRVSRLVADLERRGLVTRSADDADRRGVVVSITDDGVDRFRAAQTTHLDDLDRRLFSHLTRGEVRQLADITARIIEANDG